MLQVLLQKCKDSVPSNVLMNNEKLIRVQGIHKYDPGYPVAGRIRVGTIHVFVFLFVDDFVPD